MDDVLKDNKIRGEGMTLAADSMLEVTGHCDSYVVIPHEVDQPIGYRERAPIGSMVTDGEKVWVKFAGGKWLAIALEMR